MCHAKSTQHTFHVHLGGYHIGGLSSATFGGLSCNNTGATVQAYSCSSDMQAQKKQLRRLVVVNKVVTEREDGVKSVCIGGTLPL